MKDIILLVDDDPVNNFICNHTIKSVMATANIKIIENPSVAIDFIQQNNDKIKMLFLDINMPILTGWEVLDEIQKNFDISFDIYLLSSSINDAEKLRFKDYPFIKDYLIKPLTIEQLLQLPLPIEN